MRATGQLITLARLTAAEAMRQPACLLLALTGVAATALCPMLLMHNFGDGGRLARDGGLAFHLVFGVFIAAYAACSSLVGEKQRGTTIAVLSKPVSRATFFLAKFIGVAAVVTVFSLSAALATLLAEQMAEKFYDSERLVGYATDWLTGQLVLAAPVLALVVGAVRNYRLRRPFQSSAFVLLAVALLGVLLVSGFYDAAGRPGAYHLRASWATLPASLTIWAALLMLSALALTVSVRLSMAPTMAFCAVVLVSGLAAGQWLARLDGGWGSLLVASLVPNWQRFWLAERITAGAPGIWRAVAGAGLYAGAYSAAVLSIGVALFGESEVS